MAPGTYDIIAVGGGLGGSALAKAMAERGARVLVLESESRFRDRVRGEAMMPWGTVEARDLGIYDTLIASGGHELPWWDSYRGPTRTGHRDFSTTTAPKVPALAFYHPGVQEGLLEAAASAGAEVRRGARVRGTRTDGDAPTVMAEVSGREAEFRARLVVGADGRASMMRGWGGFAVQQDPKHNLVAGVLYEGIPVRDDACHFWLNSSLGLGALLFPQGQGQVRAYLCYRAGYGRHLSGDGDLPKFVDESLKTGLAAEYYSTGKAIGPLATFDGASTWVNHPYRKGVALIGDAAAASDPTWGQGLSLTLRDVRVLRDRLLRHDDWDEAGNAYAREHDRYYGVTHTMESWMTQMLMQVGPEADSIRERALPLWREDRSRLPDTFFSGPEQTLDEAARRRFFGEE